MPNATTRHDRRLARRVRQQRARELLAFCDRRIVMPRPVEKKIQRKPQTPAPAAPKTIGEHMIKKRLGFCYPDSGPPTL